MTNPFATSGCPREPDIVEAARHGRGTRDLDTHLASCAACREVEATVAALSKLADETAALADRRVLPKPGQLWWKAQLARRWEAETRAVAPLDMMQRVEIGVGVVAAFVLLIAFFRSLGGRAAATGADVVPAVAGWLQGSFTGVIAIAVLLLAAGSVVALRVMLGGRESS
jgi:predicted anti-sigma-YlaC factor YlaD